MSERITLLWLTIEVHVRCRTKIQLYDYFLQALEQDEFTVTDDLFELTDRNIVDVAHEHILEILGRDDIPFAQQWDTIRQTAKDKVQQLKEIEERRLGPPPYEPSQSPPPYQPSQSPPPYQPSQSPPPYQPSQSPPPYQRRTEGE
ncbi:hypothetical protein P170DRAFT_478193 [Aspergillus steynii IBT 23096]|uniref:Uncharacterized protein n=1 Tax=Aspergillus steynii IBT 23096 TaxID=1392250 RepID=A0A2I2G393_9EURO|nr:uncharacterized protein P170DRAFT_478193 [Aspergillus steynii IBT 23096]PLB47342.1 hypothetical protein P170DRAFT_478193 [Aspergillus steynii IBT 23096]